MNGARADLPVLEGARVLLRPPREGELTELAGLMASDPQTSAWWGTSAETIGKWFADTRVAVLVVEEDGGVVGVVGYEEEEDPEYKSVSLDIGLLSCAVGRGLGAETLRVLAQWLIDERGHHRLTIDPATDNERAIGAYRKVGFKPVGVMREYERRSDGSWHDSLLMDMLAGELEDA